MGKNYCQLTRYDRIKIETLFNAKFSIKDIAEQTGFHYSTIWREIRQRGSYMHRNSDWTEEARYSSDLAQERCEANKKLHGNSLKIGKDMEFARYVEGKVLDEKRSPQAVLSDIKKEEKDFSTKICLSTLYNYIRSGVFLNIRMKDLPLPRKERRKMQKKCQKRASAGTSIEQRPEAANKREELGHWEMDSIVGPVGKSIKAMLMMTERLSLKQYVFVLKNHTAGEVVRTLDWLERKMGARCFRETFKTITVDNGVEFSDVKGMERSKRNKTPRTKVYYCHAYSSWERGRNENQNRFFRRFYPKGVNFDHVTQKEAKRIQDWMNNYPRPSFGGRSASEMYEVFLKREREGKTA